MRTIEDLVQIDRRSGALLARVHVDADGVPDAAPRAFDVKRGADGEVEFTRVALTEAEEQDVLGQLVGAGP